MTKWAICTRMAHERSKWAFCAHKTGIICGRS